MKQAKNRVSQTRARNAYAVNQLLQFMRRSMHSSEPRPAIDLKALINEGRAGYKLDELLKQCDPMSPPPADMTGWENLADAGREKLAGDWSACCFFSILNSPACIGRLS